ncbi:MAG: 2'-5' RNA ligase [Rhodanobacter sp.]
MTDATALDPAEGVSLPGQPFVSAIAVEVQAIPTPSSPTELPAGIDYFFAVRPDDQARLAIAEAAARFRKAQRVSGVPVPVESLHLLLCPMGRTELLQQPLEQALLAAGAAVQARGFVAVLDTAMRCLGKGGQFPFVVCADQATTRSTLALRKTLAEAQRKVGLHVGGVSSFHAHVALQYGPAIDAIEESITPIQWHVREFLLLRSFFGQSRHQVIGAWPLASEPEAEPDVVDMLAELANLPDLPDLPDAY